MKVSELTGAMLDYWVAMAEGLESPEIVGGVCQYVRHDEPGDDGWWTAYDPSEEWGIAGPIIERERIDVIGSVDGGWYAVYNSNPDILEDGPTPLVAVMRCYVASKFGEEVPTAEVESRP